MWAIRTWKWSINQKKISIAIVYKYVKNQLSIVEFQKEKTKRRKFKMATDAHLPKLASKKIFWEIYPSIHQILQILSD